MKISIIFLLFVIPNAYAVLSDDLGIQLSKSCTTMIKNNLTTNCPTYEEIMFIFPDTSDQKMSGGFEFKDGYLQRGQSNYRDSFMFYQYDIEKRLWIDPSPRIATSVKLIIIEPRLDEYKITGQYVNTTSIDVGHQRWVNEGCYIARISATDWQFLIGDTLLYLDSDCEITNFDSIKKITWQKTIIDITTSYKYKLEQWFKQAIEDCGKRFCIPT